MNIVQQIKKKIFGRGIFSVEELRKMGMKIGENTHIYTQYIDFNHCFLIEIGDDTTLASDVRLLAHDASTKKVFGYTKIGRIKIGNHVFIGAQSIILPNVSIGDYVIIGAGSVVTKDIPNHTIAVGNPCHIIDEYDNYISRMKCLYDSAPCWKTPHSQKSQLEKEKMYETLKDGGWGFDL